MNGSPRRLYLVLVMILVVFILDIFTPIGVLIWLLYLGPLLIVSQRYTRAWNLAALSLCSVLILVGYRLSPKIPFPEPYLYNRLIAILIMWMAVHFLHKQREAGLKIQQLNNALVENITQLERSNQDLKSFCYTISHDIRAPLVRMAGFSNALMEDYSYNMDRQGKMYMERIITSCSSLMLSLDKVLDLSKLSFSNLNITEVNLSDLAQSIIQELAETQPERKVFITITPQLIARGDRDLLRLAMENFLGNAWKFTSKQQDARIDFGVTEQNGQIVYFIRDNGSGFDMAFVDKLFKPFQRLHSTEDFPGTGVGLASVYKIIQRHNGEVWAESTLGKGATFYFTLSPLQRP